MLGLLVPELEMLALYTCCTQFHEVGGGGAPDKNVWMVDVGGNVTVDWKVSSGSAFYIGSQRSS